MIVSVVLFFVFVGILLLYFTRRPKHFPPGPLWLPLVGNKFYVTKLSNQLGGFHLALLELSRKWQTNILGLKLGSELIVVVFKFPLVKSILSSEDYISRPINFFMKLRCLGSIKGVTCTNGETWIVQRSFTIKTLRNLGFGRANTEQQVQREIHDILLEIQDNEEIQVGKLIAPAVISILWSLITGSRLHRKNKRLNKLLDLFQRRSRSFDMSGGLLAQYPWMRYLAPELTGYNLIKNINSDLQSLFMEAIEEHQNSWTPELSDSDFIYSFLTEMKKEDAHASFTIDQLLMVCLDLFIAGALTTSSTLDFAFLAMIDYPDIQRKAQEHIDEVCDRNTSVRYSDRHKLAYIEAILFEVLRFRTITPIIGPRGILKDQYLGGYIIPKDATILIHTHSVHMDPQSFPEPDQFKPERFLNEQGELVYRDELISFGSGKRRCIGESLARMCIFLFFTEILRNYTIVRRPGEDSNTETPLAGITISAQYLAKFVKRQRN